MYWLYFRDDSDESIYGRISKSFFQYNLNKISNLHLAAATAQTRPSNGIPVAGLGGYQVGKRPIVLRQLLLW